LQRRAHFVFRINCLYQSKEEYRSSGSPVLCETQKATASARVPLWEDNSMLVACFRKMDALE
jgi:hypothetical protein